MHKRIISCLLIATLILLTFSSGCTSSTVRENPVTVAGEKTAAGVYTASEIRTTPSTTRQMVTTPPVLPAGTKEHTFAYVLNGEKGMIVLPMSDALYQEYMKKSTPPYKNDNPVGNTSYWRGFINDPEQQPYVTALADAIRAKTSNADDQAHIAVSLVQHIPYNINVHGERYPYEVLYQNRGMCGDKSMLLALLLKDLGFGSSVFYFLPEDHMTAGIKVSSPYDFRNSGYAFIEATEPSIITDSLTDPLAQQRVASTMEFTEVGTGRALSTIVNDYNDARQWAALEAKGKTLSTSDYQAWQALNTKYDLSYYT